MVPEISCLSLTMRRSRSDPLLSLSRYRDNSKNLVLRGSVPLQAWVGDEAREPGDLDFVVIPQSMGIADLRAREMYNGIIGAVHQQPAAGLTADRVSAEDIWSYDRAPGRRLTFPFAIARTLCGVVQVDFVFGQWLPVPPQLVRIPLIGEPVLTATAQLSLAWKLLWLETDNWPKGKDLYDAVLLAEHTTVSRDVVRAVLRREVGRAADSFTAASVLRWTVDWDSFRDAYPTITGDLERWQNRLALALARSFGE